MTLAACPLCGTQTIPGTPCPNCGTPTPAPSLAGEPQPRDPTPVMQRQANQWDAILEKLRRVAAPKYEVRALLGFGGMAGVYLAQEPRLGRQVAIKVMSPGLMVDPKLVDRFMQEAKTIAGLMHPNIVTIYEVDEREDLHWFTMTYVAGRTLAQVMTEASAPLPYPVVRAWLYQIGDALAYAHHHGIIHRDIKPGNVLLDQRGNALVTDFGIAKVADIDAGLTRTGMLVGTPAYMSPEQCSSGRVTGASDQYSLGAMIYQMLTGQPPFAGATLAVLQAHVSQQPTPILELRPDCPADLAEVAERMLAKQPEDRFPTLSNAISAANATPPGLEGPVREQLIRLATPAAAITVSPWFDHVAEGSREQLRVLVVDAAGTVLQDRRVEWTSDDAVVATVTESGVLHAFAPGQTQLIARSGPAATALPLTVERDPVRDIEISPAEASVPAGGRMSLEAVVHDWDGARLEERAVLWSSSQSSVARVNEDGMVHAITRGTATITASTGGKTATCQVIVTEALAQPQAADSPPGARAATLVGGGTRTRSAGRTGVASQATTGGAATRAQGQGGAAAGAAPSGRTAAGMAANGGPARGRKGLLIGGLAVVAVAAIALAVLQPWSGGGSGASGSDPVETAGPESTGGAPAGAANPGDTVDVGTGGTDATVAAADTGSAAGRTGGPGEVAGAPTGGTEGQRTGGGETGGGRRTGGAGEAEPERPPPPSTTGTVAIAGTLPAGASITYRDATGATRALSGRQAELPPGEYVFTFRAADHEPDEESVTVRVGETVTWTPDVRRIVVAPPPDSTPPTPTTDPRADQADVQAAIRGFIGAFDRRDANVVVPLLPSDIRDNWRNLLENRSVTDWKAEAADIGTPRLAGDTATAAFSIRVSFRSANQNINQTLPYTATLERRGGNWTLVSLRTGN